MCLDSSVWRAPARLAVGARFYPAFGHFLLLRSVVIRSRCWTDGGRETCTSLTVLECNKFFDKTGTAELCFKSTAILENM
jgi:hypothetical protein